MFRKITSFVVAVSVMLVLQFAGCYAMSLDRQSMHCCRRMPCSPANKAHDCCKQMVLAQTPNALPAIHAPFAAPIAITGYGVVPGEVEQAKQAVWPGVDPPRHSPPPLYIVHASLLI